MSDGTPTPLAINNNGQEIPEAPPPQQTLSSAQHQFVTSVISLQEEQEQKEPSSRDKTFIQIQDAPPSADEIHQQPNYIAPVGLGLQQEPVLIPPSERRVWAQRRIFRPYFMWLISLVQVSTMIASFVINSQVTGTVLQMEPFNPMIGPSIGVSFTLVNH